MFGYVTVCEPELKMKDFRKYRSYYCGLCQELKEKYGFSGQMTDNSTKSFYDYSFTLTAICISSFFFRLKQT